LMFFAVVVFSVILPRGVLPASAAERVSDGNCDGLTHVEVLGINEVRAAAYKTDDIRADLP